MGRARSGELPSLTLRGVAPEAGRAYAEMWIGDHPGLPAFAEVGGAGGAVAPLAETTGAACRSS